MGRPFGRYELKAKIAQGGMAEVFLALQRGPGGFEKMVAIKQLLPELVEEPGFVEMFLDEARIVASLSHPNICQIYELGEEGGRHYIAMEYLSGPTLSRLWKKSLREGLPLAPPLVAYVVARAAEGLAHAHERAAPDGRSLEIVHRDVSPQNILVTYDGQVKLVDFGIARAATRQSRTGTGVIKGKLSYMSPEQLQGQPLDGKSDVFALGVVLHEMLTGRPLFRGETDLETMQQIIHREVPSVRGAPGVSTALARLVDRATSRAVASRPSARELALGLEEAVSHARPLVNSEVLANHVRRVFVKEQAEERARLSTAVLPNIDDYLFNAPAVPAEASTAEVRPPTRRFAPARPSRWLPIALVTVALIVGGAGAHLMAGRRAPPPVVESPTAARAKEVEVPLSRPEAKPQEAESPTAAAQVSPVSASRSVSLVRTRRTGREPKSATVVPAASVGRRGRLTFDTVPWTDVYVKGAKVGTTPLVEVELPAGAVQLRLVNEEARIDRRYDVIIPLDQTVTLPRARL